mgnify:FL=1
MKSITQKILLLLCFTIALSACNTENSKCEQIDNSRPSNAITYKEMASMFSEYDNGQKKVLDTYRKEIIGAKDSVESVSHFYEIKQLKQYIAYLERISKEKDIELTGVRIFSAAYPKNHANRKLRGRQTLVFMPTAEINGYKGVAFEPLYSKKGKPVKFTQFLSKFSSEESKKIMRASLFNTQKNDDLESSGTNKLDPTPPM